MDALSDRGDTRIAIIGLGYVGLPLAVAFGKVHPTIGFDTNTNRVKELVGGYDRTQEVDPEDLESSVGVSFTSDSGALREANVYVVTVPTPVDAHKRPDLSMLRAASADVGRALRRGDVVIYESTVYPGATEEECVPVLAEVSGLGFNDDFFVGYSPERINPGDRVHKLPDIRKVTSGSTPKVAQLVDELYAGIVSAGTYMASSIRVAEAAKVIENTQRDVNIALVNELAVLFNRLGLDSREVLEAAGTKWNFLPFTPGLVGGHCIGVDPYYLTHKAQEVGHHPEVILAGRRINDAMGGYIADQVVLLMARKGNHIGKSRVLVLGLAFKENCPDLRNSRVVDIVARFREYDIEVDIHDDWVDRLEAKGAYGVDLVDLPNTTADQYSAVVVAVGHDEYAGMERQLRALVGQNGVIYDVKGVLDRSLVDGRL